MLSTISAAQRLRLLLVVGLATFCVGCPDPDASFDDFVKRYQKTYKPPPPAACGESAQQVEGDFLFALSAVVPTKPLLFAAKLTPEAGALKLSVQPLAIDRKTLVGMPIDLGPFPIDDKGNFTADLPELTVPGEANPITKCTTPGMCDASKIVAKTSLTGAVCKDFICGDVSGKVSKPIEIDLVDSTFTFDRLEMPGVYPEPPQIDCAGKLAVTVDKI